MGTGRCGVISLINMPKLSTTLVCLYKRKISLSKSYGYAYVQSYEKFIAELRAPVTPSHKTVAMHPENPTRKLNAVKR